MRNRLLQKLTMIAVWIVISIGLYQCSRMGFVEMNREVTYEKNQKESTGEKLTENKEDKQKQEIQVPQGHIRVLIKTNSFAGIYHDELVFSSENGMYIEQNKEITTLAPSEELVITASEMQDKQISIKAYENGFIQIHNVYRAEEVFYRGSMECFGTKEGIVLVNELPVEEYLYGVVPSEMPSSYPLEALKAQAISARTYTYFHMQSFAYPEWEAHVDDSTTFQVYKNISENEGVNQAVDATKNQVMKYQDELIESFYYSTSSGRSSGYEVWKPQEEKVWLQGIALTVGPQDKEQAVDFSYNRKVSTEVVQEKESAYRAYITQGNINDTEYQEPWYRWEYSRNFDDIQEFLKRIETLQAKYPEEIRIQSKYANKEKLTQESEILSCRIIERAASGMVQQLCIQTENFEIVIKTQQCIREVLAKNGDVLSKNDGSEFTLGELLPSAYFYFDALYEDNCLKSITIHGGGFGHGAGMSQNGAKCLAGQGITAQDILKYYYTDVEIEEVTYKRMGNK